MTDKVDLINAETGEIEDKPYRSEAHLGFGKTLATYQRYIADTLRNPDDPDSFARMSPDTLTLVLAELSAMYESLSAFLANQKLWIADLKTSRQLKFARQYMEYKRLKGHTNETARMQAILDCEVEDRGIDKAQHVFNVTDALKKSIVHYHDAVRSTLSYEKSLGNMSRGN